MFVGGWVIIIGAIVISTAMHLAQFVVGRFILGVGIQIMVVSAPAYAVEIAPPHWRGRAVGQYHQFSALSYDFHEIGLTLSRFLQLWLVWRQYSCRCDYLRNEQYQQQLPMENSVHSSVLRLCSGHYLRLVYSRIATLAPYSGTRGGSCRLSRQVPRKWRSECSTSSSGD